MEPLLDKTLLENPPTQEEGRQTRRDTRIRIAVLASLVLVGGSMGFLYAGDVLNQGQEAAAATATVTPPDSFKRIESQLIAEAVLVADARTGRVLFERNQDAQLPLASLTKVMLAFTVSDVLENDDTVTITPTALATEGDSGLIEYERWGAEDLIDFTLIVSSNDGAVALAEAAGSIVHEDFPEAPSDAAATVWLMNKKAENLALSQTYFLNPSGLDESATMASAFGSAADVANLFVYLTQNRPELLAKTAQREEMFVSRSGFQHRAQTTNDAVGRISGLIAAKTGFTDLAGGNLAVVFDAGVARPIVVVVLGSTEEGRFDDVELLTRAARDFLQREDALLQDAATVE